jgi:hypothetical protein
MSLDIATYSYPRVELWPGCAGDNAVIATTLRGKFKSPLDEVLQMDCMTHNHLVGKADADYALRHYRLSEVSCFLQRAITHS